MAALTADKVIDIVAKVLPHDYGGCPLLLSNVTDKLVILRDSVVHEDNKALLISLVKAKLSGKARDALREEVESINEIIEDLKNGCKGQSSWQIATTLEGMRISNRSKYISDINEISEKLKHAYINEGTSRAAAKMYVINAITKNIRTNFSSNPVMVSAMTGEFSDINAVMHKFESIQIEKEASIMMMRNKNSNNYNVNRYNQNNGINNNNKNNNNNLRKFNNNNQNKNYSNSGNYNSKNFNNNRQYSQNNFNNNSYNRNGWHNKQPNNNHNSRNIRAIIASGNGQGPDALGYSTSENANPYQQQSCSYQITNE